MQRDYWDEAPDWFDEDDPEETEEGKMMTTRIRIVIIYVSCLVTLAWFTSMCRYCYGADLRLLAIERNIVKYTNAERVKRGLRPLVIDRGLMKSCRDHTSWMARRRRMVHTRLPVAENIGMGYSDSRDVVRGWMRSPGHKRNLLNGSHRRIGVAAFRSAGGSIYWGQQFK